MKTRTLLVGLSVVGLVWLLSGRELGAGDKKPSIEEIMAKLGTPGPNHKLLQPLIGKWECKVKIFMGPGKEPIETVATAQRKWIMGERYIEETYDGTAFGQPFKGLGLIGYDNAKKKFAVAWIDSMSTSITFSTGTYSPESKTFTYLSEGIDPYFGSGKMKLRDVLRIVDADHHILEMYRQPPDGKEFKAMEISCTRKK
jgi:hypothetical protein